MARVRSVMRCFNLVDVHITRPGIDIHVHRRRAHIPNRRHRREKSERNRDYFIARSDARRKQRQMQRAGA